MPHDVPCACGTCSCMRLFVDTHVHVHACDTHKGVMPRISTLCVTRMHKSCLDVSVLQCVAVYVAASHMCDRIHKSCLGVSALQCVAVYAAVCVLCDTHAHVMPHICTVCVESNARFVSCINSQIPYLTTLGR